MTNKGPTHDLEQFKRNFAAGRVKITDAASAGRRQLGFTIGTRRKVIAEIKPNEFYKTMLSYDGEGWQDVYRTTHQEFQVYVKFTANAMTQFSLLSFKPLKGK